MGSTYGPKSYAPLRTDSHGYERWTSWNRGKRERVRVHRLLAVAEYGFDAVAGNDVHHVNNIGWDNRPDNIEIKGMVEHRQHHGAERSGTTAYRDEETLRNAYSENSIHDTAEHFGVAPYTIQRWLKKHNIETRSRGDRP